MNRPSLVLGALALVACSDPESPTGPRDAGSTPALDAAPMAPDVGPGPTPDAAVDRSQRPPTDADALEAWLAEGHYLAWHCEESAHPARPPGAHRVNRICTNDALTSAPAGAFPPGAAAVKELYDEEGGAITGFAVSLKLEIDSRGGAGWYWYERAGSTVYADGTGARICTGCHAGADSSFAPTARDFVFTVVP